MFHAGWDLFERPQKSQAPGCIRLFPRPRRGVLRRFPLEVTSLTCIPCDSGRGLLLFPMSHCLLTSCPRYTPFLTSTECREIPMVHLSLRTRVVFLLFPSHSSLHNRFLSISSVLLTRYLVPSRRCFLSCFTLLFVRLGSPRLHVAGSFLFQLVPIVSFPQVFLTFSFQFRVGG